MLCDKCTEWKRSGGIVVSFFVVVIKLCFTGRGLSPFFSLASSFCSLLKKAIQFVFVFDQRQILRPRLSNFFVFN